MREIKKKVFVELFEANQKGKLSIIEISKLLGISERYAEVYRTLLDNYDNLQDIFSDHEVVEMSTKLAMQKQKFMDSNRIERKTFRDHARMNNALEELNKAVLEKFDEIGFDVPDVQEYISVLDGNQAIIQLSDTHFNELVDLEDNSYDFDIASRRMALFASEAKRILKAYGVEKVVLAMTGDMINSDRRLDEKLNMATNRMTAAMIATNLIQYFILDLMDNFNEMDVVYVTGNESRSFEFGYTDMVVTDNYDSIIFNMLKLLFKDSESVNFISSNPVESIIKVNGKNVLLMHGTNLGKTTQENIQKYVGKYSNKGIAIDYVLFGHIHYCNIGDSFARSGSLVGSNTYSEYGLGLMSKASQNIHIFTKKGSIHNVRVELQDVDDVEGYPIRKDLDAYNTKSASKLHKQFKVIEINNNI